MLWNMALRLNRLLLEQERLLKDGSKVYETSPNIESIDIDISPNKENLDRFIPSPLVKPREINKFRYKNFNINRSFHRKENSYKRTNYNSKCNDKTSSGRISLYNFIIRNNNLLIIDKYKIHINLLFSFKMADPKKQKEALDAINAGHKNLDAKTMEKIKAITDKAVVSDELINANLIKIPLKKITDGFGLDTDIDNVMFNEIMDKLTVDPNNGNQMIDLKGNNKLTAIKDIQLEEKIKYFTQLRENYKSKQICFKCGRLKHNQAHQCTKRCNRCNGNHDSKSCKANILICSWCGKIRGHTTDCPSNSISILKSITCPICKLRGHLGINCNSLFLAIASLRPNRIRRTLKRRRRQRNNFWSKNKGIPRSRRRN